MNAKREGAAAYATKRESKAAYAARDASRGVAVMVCTGVALAVHAAVLFGFHPERGAAPLPYKAQDSVMVDIASTSGGETLVATPPQETNRAEQPETPPVVPPTPTPEPIPVARPVPRPVKKPVRPVRNKPAATTENAPTRQTAPGNTTPGNTPPAGAGTSGEASFAPESLGYGVNPRPKYPKLARDRGQQGTVRLLARVDAQGTPTTVSIARSSGFSLLDKAALDAVKRWKFKPARRGGAAVPGEAVVPIQFRLQ